MDIFIERGARLLAGVEVKAAATVSAANFRGLRKLKVAAGKRFVCGVVLYDGEICAGFGDARYAVPLRALWEIAQAPGPSDCIDRNLKPLPSTTACRRRT